VSARLWGSDAAVLAGEAGCWPTTQQETKNKNEKSASRRDPVNIP